VRVVSKYLQGLSQGSPQEVSGSIFAEIIRCAEHPKLFFVYFTDNYDPDYIYKLANRYLGDISFIGACVPGFILKNRLVTDGIAVCLLDDPKMNVFTHLQRNISDDPYTSGEVAAKSLLQSSFSGTIITLPDGFASNISEILRGMHNILGTDFEYAGGGTGDNLKFQKTYQFTNQGMASGAMALALVDSHFSIKTGHGWKPSSSPLMVTKAEGKTVFELDGMPAFERYSELLGGIDRNNFSHYGMKHPLGIPIYGDNFLIRDPVMVNFDGSITFVTEVPNNTIAVIMQSQISELISTAEKVTHDAVEHSSRVALLFNCVSRYLLMGESFQEEIDAVYRGIKGAELIGILSFGEVSSASGTPLFYNKTTVVAADK